MWPAEPRALGPVSSRLATHGLFAFGRCCLGLLWLERELGHCCPKPRSPNASVSSCTAINLHCFEQQTFPQGINNIGVPGTDLVLAMVRPSAGLCAAGASLGSPNCCSPHLVSQNQPLPAAPGILLPILLLVIAFMICTLALTSV